MGRRNKEELINDILDAAISCHRENNCGSIQITDVAARAGVSTRTLHRYFAQKDELVGQASIRILEHVYKDFAEEYYKLDTQGLNGLDKLMRFMNSQVEFYKRDSEGAILFVEAMLIAMRRGLLKGFREANLGREIGDIITANVELGIKDGSIRSDIDPKKVTLLVVTNFNGLMQNATFLMHSDFDKLQEDWVFSLFEEYNQMLRKYIEN
ncbi:MAG TPA: TetR/AcrR family transcriptional regulator [Anaerovoracaceae bacterium]|nr:TetR/AcrR family transcriptional regulator [Anaerovoracaceae bacterium]